ncbi:MAG TPA: hypothetical protein VEI52_28295 [Terriglobales bacterium]|nr:hypothetical protein [Terriglobales bacterium]
MLTIVQAEFVAAGIKRFVIEAPRIARKQKAGQFVILRIYEQGERIPLTIESSDRARSNISIVVQAVAKTTHVLNSQAEMRARKEEVKHAREEGIAFHMLTSPTQFPVATHARYIA